MPQSIEQCLQYLETLEVAPITPAAVRAAITGDGDSAVVVDSAVISFVGNLTGQQKEDVMHSALLAQLAANKLFDREKEVDKWYAKYKEVLETVGWNIQSFRFANLEKASSHRSVDQVVFFIMESFLPGNELAMFKKTIDALKESKNAKAYSIFKNESWSHDTADFLAGSCVLDVGKNVVWRISCYDYSTSGFDGNVLFYKFGSDKVRFDYSTQSMVLNEGIYGRLRDKIRDKIIDRADEYIDGIEI